MNSGELLKTSKGSTHTSVITVGMGIIEGGLVVLQTEITVTTFEDFFGYPLYGLGLSCSTTGSSRARQEGTLRIIQRVLSVVGQSFHLLWCHLGRITHGQCQRFPNSSLHWFSDFFGDFAYRGVGQLYVAVECLDVHVAVSPVLQGDLHLGNLFPGLGNLSFLLLDVFWRGQITGVFQILNTLFQLEFHTGYQLFTVLNQTLGISVITLRVFMHGTDSPSRVIGRVLGIHQTIYFTCGLGMINSSLNIFSLIEVVYGFSCFAFYQTRDITDLRHSLYTTLETTTDDATDTRCLGDLLEVEIAVELRQVLFHSSLVALGWSFDDHTRSHSCRHSGQLSSSTDQLASLGFFHSNTHDLAQLPFQRGQGQGVTYLLSGSRRQRPAKHLGGFCLSRQLALVLGLVVLQTLTVNVYAVGEVGAGHQDLAGFTNSTNSKLRDVFSDVLQGSIWVVQGITTEILDQFGHSLTSFQQGSTGIAFFPGSTSSIKRCLVGSHRGGHIVV